MQSNQSDRAPASKMISIPSRPIRNGEEGLAVLIALMGLSVFSLLGLYMAFNATTELRVSDNYESQIQAGYAAQAGLNHARALLAGLNWNDLLQGPDATYSTSNTYTTQAKIFLTQPLDF